MPPRIEDYALIGDMRTAALVGRDGSIDWLCLPRFDSGACFAALLGSAEHGRWQLAPGTPPRAVRRAYREQTAVLETKYEFDGGGVARVIDSMPPGHPHSSVIRIVEGVRGRVPMRMELGVRFDYGSIVPWVHLRRRGFTAIAGPDALVFRAGAPFHSKDFRTVAEFTVSAGERVAFVMTHFPSHRYAPPIPDADAALDETERWWRAWTGRCRYEGEWRDAVMRSLITLNMLTYASTGGIVAAPTTSLPEQPGGVRNWDYRYCWLRDAAFSLYALLTTGYKEEAGAWRDWLLRAVAGRPEDLRIVYGIGGERRLAEMELAWLPGFQGARPVRVGNAARDQFQLGVYGELMGVLHVAGSHGLHPSKRSWQPLRTLMEFLESGWRRPDEGIWEVRGRRRHFTYSKVMAWVTMDRAVKAVEQLGLKGPVERWQRLRAEIHDEVWRKGFNAERNAFVQFYGSKALDASLLLMPMFGFLPPEDPRMRSTVAAIERELAIDGFVARYSAVADEIDGLPSGKAPSCRARSGSRRTSRCRAGTTRRARCSSGCLPSAMTSACWRKNTTCSESGSSAISRRPLRT